MSAAVESRLAYMSVIAVVLGAVAIFAMVYGFTIEFKLPLPQIEVNIKKAAVEWMSST